MIPEFQVYEDEKGQYRWRLMAGGGRLLAVSSDGYVRKSGAMRAIELLKGNDLSGGAEVFQDRTGAYRWYQEDADGAPVASGADSFPRRADCTAAIGLVHNVAPEAPVRDMTAPGEGPEARQLA